MNEKLISLKIEGFIRFINQDEEQYAAFIEIHPYEEILCALTKAKSLYPEKKDIIQLHVERYKDMGDKRLETLIDEGYDVEGLTSDLDCLKETLME